jgi:dipicolinate synthase subunit A
VNKSLKFILAGSDNRQHFLYNILKNNGFRALYLSDKELENYNEECDVILLPVPSSTIYFDKVKKLFKGNEYIFGCNISKFINKNIADKVYTEKEIDLFKTLNIVEYMANEAVAYKNAVATAEGAIAEAIVRSSVNLSLNHSLIVGYGKCGEVLACKLKGLGSYVTFIERKASKRAQAEAYGYKAIDFNSDNYKELIKFKYVFNTVPAMVVDESMLKAFDKNVTIIDIASRPGGVDYDYCKKNGINAVNALGLPGKYSPETSADILYQVICENLL